MSRLHNDQDVYLGNDLAYTSAQIVEFNEHGRLRVNTRADAGGQWTVAAEFTAVEVVTGTATQWVWEATNAEGEHVRITAIRRQDTRCCGR